MSDNLIWLILIVGVGILMVYVYFALTVLVNEITHSSNRKRMFRALNSAILSYYESGNSSDCFAEIELIFKHIINNDDLLKRYYSNTGILLEKYLVRLNTGDAKKENIKDIEGYKKNILELIKEYEKKNPTDCISGANSVLLNQLVECSKNNENNKFNEIVKQLAIEMKSLQDAVFEKDKENRKQNIISTVGIVLSVVFGIMTFMQFFI